MPPLSKSSPPLPNYYTKLSSPPPTTLNKNEPILWFGVYHIPLKVTPVHQTKTYPAPSSATLTPTRVEPSYDNFNTLIRASTFSGILNPRPGSPAGRLILQNQKLHRLKRPDSSFQADRLSSPSSPSSPATPYSPQSGGKNPNIKSHQTPNPAFKQPPLPNNKRRTTSFVSSTRPTTAILRPLTNSSVSRSSSTPTISRPHSASAVRVTISSAGKISTVLKPEFGNIAAKQCQFVDIDELRLTSTSQRATNNAELDYDYFDPLSRTKLTFCRNAHRKQVAASHRKSIEINRLRVLENIESKEMRRVERAGTRLSEIRQMKVLTVAKLLSSVQALAPSLISSREEQARAIIENSSALLIQRSWKFYFGMKMMRLVLAFKRLGLSFTVNLRIRRKNSSAALIGSFLNKVKKTAPVVMRKFTFNIRRAQSVVRSFLACRNARREIMGRNWVRIEQKIRLENAAINKVKKQSRLSVPNLLPELLETQDKFKQTRKKVAALFCKVNELDHVQNASAEEMKEASMRKKRIQDTANLLGSEGGRSEVWGGKEANTDAMMASMIDPAVRNRLIVTAVREFRISYLKETDDFDEVHVHQATSNDCMRLFDESSGALQRMVLVAEEQMTAKVKVKPTFCMFTGNYGGRTWRMIIEEAILKDRQDKIKNSVKIVYRPADQFIRQSILRLERASTKVRRRNHDRHEDDDEGGGFENVVAAARYPIVVEEKNYNADAEDRRNDWSVQKRKATKTLRKAEVLGEREEYRGILEVGVSAFTM